jgi:phosphomannomutase
MMALNGIDVVVPQLKPSFTDKISPVASPVLALATRNMGIPMSVLLTASHNPWNDGGYNFLTDTGMVADDSKVRPIAQKMEDMTRVGEVPKRQGRAGKTVKFNPYEMYKQHIEDNKIIDFAKIREMDIDIFYEDFGGTGGYYFPKLLKDNGIPVQKVLSSKTEGPNPTRNNLMNLSLEVTKSKNPFRIGLATDGDSDRFGVVDENGNFINSSDVILLATYHLVKNKTKANYDWILDMQNCHHDDFGYVGYPGRVFAMWLRRVAFKLKDKLFVLRNARYARKLKKSIISQLNK